MRTRVEQVGGVERWAALAQVQVRAPALGPDDLPHTPAPGRPGRLAALWQVDRLRAAVTAAAPALAGEIDSCLADPASGGEDRLAAALHRYAVRATTRATPRGLLAAVGFTTWGDATAAAPGTGRLAACSGVAARVSAPEPALIVANPSLIVRPTEQVATFQVPGDDAERALRLSPAALARLAAWTTPATRAEAPFAPEEVTALLRAGALVDTTRPTAPQARPEGAGPERHDGGDELCWVEAPVIAHETRRRLEKAMTALSRLGQALPADPALRRYAAAYEAIFGTEVTPLDRVVDPVLGLGRPPPRVIRWARLPEDTSVDDELHRARVAAATEALRAIPDLARAQGVEEQVADDLLEEVRSQLDLLTGEHEDIDEASARSEQARTLRLAVIAHKRRTVVHLRDQGVIDDTVLRQLQAHLDGEEIRLRPLADCPHDDNDVHLHRERDRAGGLPAGDLHRVAAGDHAHGQGVCR